MKQHITLSSLPSKGEYYSSEKDYLLEIPLYTFKDILYYNNYSVHNYIHELLRDIDTLNVDHVEDLLLYDLSAVSFLKKCMSIKESIFLEVPFKCSECEKKFIRQITLRDIDFKTGLSLPDKIKIGEDLIDIKIPTLKDARKLSQLFLSYPSLPPKEIFVICCYLDFFSNPNRIKHVVENAKQEDIVKLLNLVDNLDPLLPNKIKCTNCEKETTVTLSALTVDMFQLFRVNY